MSSVLRLIGFLILGFAALTAWANLGLPGAEQHLATVLILPIGIALASLVPFWMASMVTRPRG